MEVAEEGQDVPEFSDDGAIVRIEHGDGGVTVSLDGRPIEDAPDKGPEGWFDNLAEKIEPSELSRVAEDLLRGIDDDIQSRTQWIDTITTGLKLLGLTIEKPNATGPGDAAPVEGMSTVRHPLLLEACLRFSANARSEFLPTDGPVKIRDDSPDGSSDQRDQLADALETDLNHFLTTVATEFYPDTDRMLFKVGFCGDGFKKVFFCPLRNRPVSESVEPDDLIVNNAATDLGNARRITHRIMMRPSVVRRMQILGVYRDIDLPDPNEPKTDSLKRAKKEQQGQDDTVSNPLDRDREIYECCCELDIKGYEHKIGGRPSGLEIPYVVTIDVTSREILSVVRNYDQATEKLPEARKVFVKFPYVPGFGFWDIGLVHILGNPANALTAAWREMLDNGMFANFPGGLIAQADARQRTNVLRVAPGALAPVQTGGMPIRDAVMPLPYETAQMPALMSLVSAIESAGQRLGGTSETNVGEGRQDAPVGTTLALIEQATKIENAVHKRLHAAQAEELQLIARCFREHPESFWQRKDMPSAYQWQEQTFLQALDDYDLVPQADPNTASHTQRMMRTLALAQFAEQAPQVFNVVKVATKVVRAIGESNPQEYINPQPAPDPKAIQAQTQARTDQVKAQAADRTSQAHLITAQSKAAETHAGIAAATQPLQQAPQPPPDPLEIAKLQLQKEQLGQQHAEDLLEAENRERDRESKERIALAGLDADLVKDPNGVELLRKNNLLPPDFVERLESNEAPIPGLSGDKP